MASTRVARADQLTEAHFVDPQRLFFRFTDEFDAIVPLDRLGMAIDQMQWNTLRVVPGGEQVEVKDVRGEVVPIDAGTLRFLADANYAAEIDRSINELRLTPAEFDEAARLLHDPAWRDVPDETDLI